MEPSAARSRTQRDPGQTLQYKVLYITMSKPLALPAIASAALLGVLGDTLLRSSPWGVNFTLWTTTLATASFLIISDRPYEVRRGGGYWLAIAALFAAGLAWRDSAFLQFWNFVAVLAALSIAALRAGQANLLTVRIREHVLGVGRFLASLAAGAFPLVLHDVPWHRITGDRGWRRIGGHAAGIAVAIPLVFVFGGLFASADPVFLSMAARLVRWDVETLASHAIVMGMLAWLTAGYLGGLIAPERLPIKDAPTAGQLGLPEGRFGLPEIGIPLGAVVLMFGGFVAIQATYLFGGEDFIIRATGLGFAQYARRGFFELVAASALIVPLLLIAQWALDPQDEAAVRGVRSLAFTLLLLVALVAASAWWRMQLYTSAYGLTVDRFYAAAFIIWIGIVLAWFAVTVSRERPEQFAFGALVSGFALLALLNALNPEAIIARVNLSRSQAGKELDVSYLSRLSADAAPVIVAAWEGMDQDQRCSLYRVVDRSNRGADDWRSWSLARHRARSAVRDTDLSVVCPSEGPS